MAVQSFLQASFQTNLNAGPNQSAPQELYASTVTAGTVAAGPVGLSISTSTTLLPLATSTAGTNTGPVCLKIQHTGAQTDPAINLHIVNASSQETVLTIQPGGYMIFFNVQLPGATVVSSFPSTYATPQAWYLKTPSGTTTASVTLVQ